MFDQNLAKTIFGRLSWESFPVHEPILLVTFAVVVLGGLAIVGLVTKYKLWGWLWREWFTTVDHKKIGRGCLCHIDRRLARIHRSGNSRDRAGVFYLQTVHRSRVVRHVSDSKI